MTSTACDSSEDGLTGTGTGTAVTRGSWTGDLIAWGQLRRLGRLRRLPARSSTGWPRRLGTDLEDWTKAGGAKTTVALFELGVHHEVRKERFGSMEDHRHDGVGEVVLPGHGLNGMQDEEDRRQHDSHGRDREEHLVVVVVRNGRVRLVGEGESGFFFYGGVRLGGHLWMHQ